MTDMTGGRYDERIKDLEDCVLLLLQATGAFESQYVEVTGHGRESNLIRIATYEEVDRLVKKQERELELAEGGIERAKEILEQLRHRRDEIGHGML